MLKTVKKKFLLPPPPPPPPIIIRPPPALLLQRSTLSFQPSARNTCIHLLAAPQSFSMSSHEHPLPSRTRVLVTGATTSQQPITPSPKSRHASCRHRSATACSHNVHQRTEPQTGAAGFLGRHVVAQVTSLSSSIRA